jgi:hypothetical protein
MRLSVLICALAFLALVLVVLASDESHQEDLGVDDANFAAGAEKADLTKGNKKKAVQQKKKKRADRLRQLKRKQRLAAKKKKDKAKALKPVKMCGGKACCGTNNIIFGTLAGHEADSACHVASNRFCGAPNKCCNKLRFGIDSNDPNLISHKDRILGAGAKFVVRYVSHQKTDQFDTPSITPTEAAQWRALKMPLVAVFEINRIRPIEGGTKEKNYQLGITDARAAKRVMAQIGGKTRPVYFAVDAFVNPVNYDKLRPDIKIRSVNAVVPYFQGIRKVMGAKRTGAYGPYTLIKGLFDRKLIKYGWQASSFDSNGRLDPRAQLYQCNVWPPDSFGSNQVDYDFAMARDFGQWGKS